MRKKMIRELVRLIAKLVHCMVIMDGMIERNGLRYTVRDWIEVSETIELLEVFQPELERILE